MPDLPAPPAAPLTAAPGSSPGVLPSERLTALRAAFGQDEANHGTTRYSVGNDGMVRVPLEAVPFLIGAGGFAMPEASDRRGSAGPIKMQHPERVGCSYRGHQYLSDKNGNVGVPVEAAPELLAHGFTPVIETPAPLSRRSGSARIERSATG